MFSEELSGNASRKRAEENRARRRQLKEQQAKKASLATPTVAAPLNAGVTSLVAQANAATGAVPRATVTGSAPLHPAPAVETPAMISASMTGSPSIAQLAQPPGAVPFQLQPPSQLSAVERAEQQRHLRARAARQTKAAIVLQSFARSFRSNMNLRSQLSEQLVKRLADLATLGKILQAKNAQTSSPSSSSETVTASLYVPPVATTTLFARQLLFVARTTPRDGRHATSESPSQLPTRSSPQGARSQLVRLPATSWCHILCPLLEVCVLPALESSAVDKDDSTNALVSWLMDNLQGRSRLEGLIRLATIALFSPEVSPESRTVLVRFFYRLMSLVPDERVNETSLRSHRRLLVEHSRSLLLMKAVPRHFEPLTSYPPASKAFSPSHAPMARSGTPLDLIAGLRYHLMFVASSSPIPSKAKDLRENCISEKAKTLGGLLWTLVLGGIQASQEIAERQVLHCRVVSDLLTIPLLSWKIGSEPVNELVSVSRVCRNNLFDVLQSFVELHSQPLGSGAIQHLLADVPLTVCPATPLQCLLANLVQLALICPIVNGADASQMDFAIASSFFTFLSTILDAIPVATFSSRDSSVEWMTDGKGHLTPIVLSSVVIDQCKLLLLDSFVRRLFGCTCSSETLNVDSVLADKNDRDLKYEKNLLESGVVSASTLAAREARVDRSLGFWNSSKWARRITKGVTSMLSGEVGSSVQTSSPSHSRRIPDNMTLVNTSSMSRLLAGGKQAGMDATVNRNDRYVPDLFIVLCRMYSIVVARWGGGGLDDVARKRSKDSVTGRSNTASASPEACTLSLLNVLAFSTQIVKFTWATIQSSAALSSGIESVVDSDVGSVNIRAHTLRPSYDRLTKRSQHTEGSGVMLLYIFVVTLVHVLIVTDDVEMVDMERPLPLHQIRRCIEILKKLLYRACYIDNQSNTIQSNYFGLALISASSRVMRDLYDRSSRRPICVPKLWLVSDLFEAEIRQCKTHSDFVAILSHPILRVCPFLVSFKRRLKIFERIVTTSRILEQGVNDLNPFNPNPLKPGIPVRIMRGRLLEDGLATMNHLGSNMRRRIAVQYINEAGVQESGIDAGGLFKEFWTDLSAIAFNPNYALFRVTEDAGNCLYPNPSSGAAHGSDHIVLFEFLGRILGKALYEGITINPCFAHFFLSFLRGDYNYLHMLPDLSTVDPQLYNNLMFLKNYDGDAADLCLTFTITSDEFGGTMEIPLIPNGANVEVTSSNKQRYIGLVAKHYVVDRVKEQSEAFTRGLWEVIDRSWLRIFNEPELQVLISGASDGKVDVEDMRANTKYVGGYTSLDRNISRFWSVVGGMDSAQQQGLLRFVTSCERPPPLGFASMNPAFTIQRAGLARDDGKLPTASTCFNTLKLPIYSSEKVMKERLLYAIRSGSGFELT